MSNKAPQVGQFLGDMHGHGGNFLRSDTMKDIMPGYLLMEVVELPIQNGHILIESLVRPLSGQQHWLAHNKHLCVVDVHHQRVVAMWSYDSHTLGVAVYRPAGVTPEASNLVIKAYKVLKDIRNQWRGRDTHEGQGLLIDLNRYVAKVTNRTSKEAADLAPWPVDESTAYKTAAEPLIDHLRQQGYALADIDSVIMTAPKFWKRACAAYAAGSVDVAVNLFRANLD